MDLLKRIPPVRDSRFTDDQRNRFDAILERVIDSLPPRIHTLIDQVPIVVEDLPDSDLIRLLKLEGLLETHEDGSELCGLHSGIGLPDRSIEDPAGLGSFDAPGELEHICLFRSGIVSLAFASEEDGGFEGAVAGSWNDPDADERIEEEIRITLLHEIGHHFGLDEDDLDELGYG